MTKLHEILAVEGTKETAAKKLMSESLKTLGKESLFKGQTRKLTMFAEEDKQSEQTEYQELTTTVDENINYLVNPIGTWLDVVMTKERGNQSAISDLVIDGKVLIGNAPATFLLGLETKLVRVRAVYEVIPTLPPGIKWIDDTQGKDGSFISRDTSFQMKTKKDIEFKVASPATDNHPAQVSQLERTVNIGRYETTVQCGMMTPIDKARKLERIDTLIAAVKQARMRANNIDVKHVSECSKLLNYINKGTW